MYTVKYYCYVCALLKLSFGMLLLDLSSCNSTTWLNLVLCKKRLIPCVMERDVQMLVPPGGCTQTGAISIANMSTAIGPSPGDDICLVTCATQVELYFSVVGVTRVISICMVSPITQTDPVHKRPSVLCHVY